MVQIICPYCERATEIETEGHVDGKELYDCMYCDKRFVVTARQTIKYTAQKAPCQNGEPPKWIKQEGIPEIAFRGKYYCEYCGAEKVVKEECPTKEEWAEFFETND